MNNKITIITATLNAEKYIYRLIKSLQNQTDKTFDWIVIDGGSTDSTHEAIIKTVDLNVHFFCSPDFGIYDALNKGVRRTTSGYYLIVGADDVLTPNAIESYKKTILKCNADIITTVIKQNNKLIMPKSNFGWLYGLPGVASSHAVGMLFKVELHERFGFYSHKLPIAADQLFVKNALAG